jgi:hypothetical protein
MVRSRRQTAAPGSRGTKNGAGNGNAAGAPADLATFPIDDCAASLPVSDVVHEYLFAEFKTTTKTIDGLPYTLTLAPPARDHALPAGRFASAWPAGAHVVARMSPLEIHGGVPIDRVFDKDLSDLKQPLASEVQVDNLTDLLDARSGRFDLGDGKANARVKLDDNALAELAAGRSALVMGTRGKRSRPVLLRLAPLASNEPPPEPRQAVYNVGTAESFTRSPYITAEDGSNLAVRMSGEQLLALHKDGEANVRVNRRQVKLVAAEEAPIAASYAAVSQAGEGLESTATRDGVVESPSGDGAQNGAPKFTPLGQLQLALYMPWRHTWKLRGYSRGEVLHALSLAPQEEATIEVSSWDRRKRTLEDSAESEFEQTKELTQTDKDSTSVVKDVANQNSFGMNIGGNVGFNASGFNVSGSSNADARIGLNTSAKASLDLMHETVSKSSSKLRVQRQTKIGETVEIGTEEKITRRVRNANLCHTLLLNYYEVLAHYDIDISFNKAEARLCALIPTDSLGLREFNYTNVRYCESILKRVLIVPSLEPGFDAAHRLYAQDQLCEARRRNELCAGAKNVPDAEDADRQKLIAQVNRILNAYDQLGRATNNAAPFKEQSLWNFAAAAIGLAGFIWTLQFHFGGDAGVQEFQRWLYLKRARQLEPHLFDLLKTMSDERFSNASTGKAADPTSEDVQSLIEALGAIDDLAKLKPSALSADVDPLYKLLREAYGVLPMEIFTDIPPEAYSISDAGLVAALTTLREQIQELEEKKKAKEAADAMAANQAAALADLAAKDISADLEAADALVTHLNAYRNYYRSSIFQLMPWTDEFEQILAFYYPQLERQVLGFANEMLALPVNLDTVPAAKSFFDEVISKNNELVTMTDTQTVTLPTSGVHLETRLGSCSGCEEYLERVRELDLELKRAEVRIKRQEAEQQEAETERYRARLAAQDYADPVIRPPVLRIEEVGEDGKPRVPPAAPGGGAPGG